MQKHFLLISLVCLILGTTFSSCSKKNHNKEVMTKKITDGIEMGNMDLTIRPQDDFYNYANGGWMAHNTIPDDESRWGSFNELIERNDEMTLALVDKALSNKGISPTSDEGKVVTFFKVAMDTTQLNAQGVAPIQPIIESINRIRSTQDVLNFTIEMEPYLGGLIGIGVGADMKNSNINALYLGGGALGLPEREYYVGDDADSKEKRAKYVTHITRMLQFLNYSPDKAMQKAEDILAFETKIAQSKMPKEERRNPLNRYNPKTIDELNQLSPAVNWARYFEGIGAENFDEVIVSDVNYIKEVSQLLQNDNIESIKDYLRWTVLNGAASYLSQEIDEANFDFYGKTLKDLKVQKPRKERVLNTTNSVLGEALGKLYVAEYFPPEAKNVAVEMVENIRAAYKQRLQNLDWMTDSTKNMALKKLQDMTVKIGYPDKWKDYSKLNIESSADGGSYYQNILNARAWNYSEDIVKIGKPVDKSEWFMSPQTVNAYYNPPFNEIVFPAAILQAPFFDFKADAAVNYGGIGAVIGHEISHGFDDQGSRFDANGNMNNWWTDTDRKNFEERGQKLIAQYDAYEPLPGIHVNGTFTLGENIGDLGGVNSAYDGLQLHFKKAENPGQIDALTQNQRFFINWATIWRTKIRDEALKNQIKTDPHSPGVYRAVGPLVNVDAFYDAFNITAQDKMYKAEEDRVVIW